MSVEELRDFLQRVKQGSDRLRRLIDDFIFLVTLETGEVMASFRWERIYFTDLRSLIETVVRQKRPAASRRNVRLEMDLERSLPNTMLHVSYIRDALERLIDNAIKFSHDDRGHVLVRASADNKWIYIDVQDDGIGIAAEEVPNLFKSFHQLKRELLEQQGVGSGLAIVKGIAEIHDGLVKVESQEGEGSTFTLILPIVEEEPDIG